MSYSGTLGTSGDVAWPFRQYGVHYVYAKNGETIAVASSVQGTGQGYIRITSPTGVITNTTIGSITEGLIANRATELAGPRAPGQIAGASRYLPR
ncbi:hypothetical protein EON78_06165, partial [bacterium]